MLRRVVKDRIGILARFHFRDCLQCFEVDDARGRFLPVAGKAAAQIGRDRKTVDALGVGDLAGNRIFCQVDDDDLRRVRDIEPVRCRIDGEIIPTAFAADRNFFHELILTGQTFRCAAKSEQDETEFRKTRDDVCFHKSNR